MTTSGSVLLVAGSPSAPSRSSALLEAVGTRLALRGARIERLSVRELPAQALLAGDASHPALQRAADQLAAARAVVVATPVYKAAYSGVLKTFLPEGAYQLHSDLAQRLDDSVEALATEGLHLPTLGAFEPVHFSQVRCSA